MARTAKKAAPEAAAKPRGGKKKAPSKQASNEARAVLRTVRISPQKLNLVAQSIRGLSAEKAVNELRFSQKRIAKDVLKCLHTRARGRGVRIEKMFSQLTIVLRDTTKQPEAA